MRTLSAAALLLVACSRPGVTATSGLGETESAELESSGGSTSWATGSSVSSTTDGDGSSTTGSYESGGFILTSDGGSGPTCNLDDAALAFPCSVLQQDCRDDHKCSPSWWEHEGQALPQGELCVRVAARPNGLGEPCTIQNHPGSACDDCDASTRCWPAAEGHTCVAFCSGHELDLQCPHDTACAWMWDAYFPLCLPRCDPLVPSCGDGFGCVLTQREDFICFPALVGDPAGFDEPCISEGKQPCAEGLTCISAAVLGDACTAEHGCCRPICDLAAPDCDSLESCVPLLDDPAPEHLTLGVCLP
jgi:hypothetical protein